MTTPLARLDPELFHAVVAEAARQRDGLEMIASENYTSPAVMAAQGSVLTNKYAEGYPGKRYYGGCEFVDEAERLVDRTGCRMGGRQGRVGAHVGRRVVRRLARGPF